MQSPGSSKTSIAKLTTETFLRTLLSPYSEQLIRFHWKPLKVSIDDQRIVYNRKSLEDVNQSSISTSALTVSFRATGGNQGL